MIDIIMPILQQLLGGVAKIKAAVRLKFEKG
jgi:hypothetical protein